jgi:hypothetical protein
MIGLSTRAHHVPVHYPILTTTAQPHSAHQLKPRNAKPKGGSIEVPMATNNQTQKRMDTTHKKVPVR